MALTQQMMEGWVQSQGFIKETDMADDLREQRFVKEYDLHQAGYATGDDTRQTFHQLIADEQSQFQPIRTAMQTLLESTRALSASFGDRVATAPSEFAEKHATTPAELLARDAQLRDYVDSTQRGHQQTSSSSQHCWPRLATPNRQSLRRR